MKKTFVLLALALGPALAFCAEPAASVPAEAAAAKSPADRDQEALWAIYGAEPPAGVEFPSRAFFQFQDAQMRKFSTAAREFAEKYPTDVRRYNGWVQSSFTRPWFIKDFKPEFEQKPGERNLIVDQPALDAFMAQQAVLMTQVVQAPDAEERQRGGAFFVLLTDARGAAARSGKKFDVTQFRPLVDRVVAKLGDERVMPVIEQYVTELRQSEPVEAAAFEAKLQSMPKVAAALKEFTVKQAEAKAKAEAAAKVRAAEIGSVKFTAADGRAVDLASLKGKVVLVDFWATWCGPCVAEIPNVVANYQKYHDKGFEVVGISLENPNFAPKDDDAKKTAKLATAKQKMLEFTMKNSMPWPQYFDGKWWKNDYAVKFGIEAIPAMFLLDQEGKIAATEARGPDLEVQLKRLLKL